MTEPKERRVLELFSGIGGMHSAFELSGLPGTVVAAIDINTVANTVYSHNHPDTKLLTSNIQKVTPAFVKKLAANTILMSPPCQPFTRTGKQQDVADARTDALVHLCAIIGQLDEVDAILMENVKGFETSQAREMYVHALTAAGYHYQEFILSPSQLGIPNTRFRYYCLARKSSAFDCKADGVLEVFPEVAPSDRAPEYGRLVEDYLDHPSTGGTDYLLPDTLLEKRVKVLDIARSDSERTMCFTKAYTHYTEGTGSVFCPASKERLDEVLAMHKELVTPSEGLEALKSLQMRYFSPEEVARLMCFPIQGAEIVGDGTAAVGRFSFPKVTTKRQKYRLLGNSINVYVVSVLIRYLLGNKVNCV